MMSPRYQEIKATDIPTISRDDTLIHIIAGMYDGAKGPVTDIMANPTYLDIVLQPNANITIPVTDSDTSFVYMYDGSITTHDTHYKPGIILLHERLGDAVTIQANDLGAQFLFVTGSPLNEPIAWHGPIVMNTDKEIQTALYDLQNGTFIK
jgi:redox-sensitive bicupin YhaK (pirin superfamily)